MIEPKSHEFAAFISKGDAGVLSDALAVFLMQSDLPIWRREQAGDLREQFLKMIEPGERS